MVCGKCIKGMRSYTSGHTHAARNRRACLKGDHERSERRAMTKRNQRIKRGK